MPTSIFLPSHPRRTRTFLVPDPDRTSIRTAYSTSHLTSPQQTTPTWPRRLLNTRQVKPFPPQIQSNPIPAQRRTRPSPLCAPSHLLLKISGGSCHPSITYLYRQRIVLWLAPKGPCPLTGRARPLGTVPCFHPLDACRKITAFALCSLSLFFRIIYECMCCRDFVLQLSACLAGNWTGLGSHDMRDSNRSTWSSGAIARFLTLDQSAQQNRVD